MAASMKQAISGFIAGTEDSVAKIVANEINKKSTKFLEFIECLEPALSGSTGDNVARGRATGLIGDVLALLPPSFLSNDQVQVVASFLLAKLADHHSVQPAALQSLSVLTSRCSPLSEGLPTQICTTIFREIQNQTLSHADRRSNYLIFQNFLGSSMKELERMGGDFVIGFIQQMDAEKDPRNLLLVFSCAHHIISNIPLGAFTEEMFEVLGCYFPIEFTPPPNNPHGITREELVNTLRKCFAATVDFAPHCLPLLLEKIMSDLQSARLDAIQTLIACAPVYGRKGLLEFFGSITSALKKEVLMDISTELVDTSRDALTAVFKAMSPAEGVNSNRDESLTTSMVEIYQEINKFLEGVNPKKTCLAFSVCRAIAASSPTAYLTMIPMALPTVIKVCTETAQDTDKILLLQEVNAALKLMKTLQINKEQKDKLSLSQALCHLYETIMNSKSCQSIGPCLIKGITLLLTVEDLISAQTSSAFLKSLIQLGSSTEDKSLRKDILTSIRECLLANPNLLEETINSLKEDIATQGGRSWTFDCLAYAMTDARSFDKITAILLSVIAIPLGSGDAWRGLEAVHSVGRLMEEEGLPAEVMALVVRALALPLLRIAVTLCPQWNDGSAEKCKHFMSACGDVYRLIANKIALSDATMLWGKLCLVMLEGNVACIDCAGDMEIKPLQASSPWPQTRLVAFLEGFLAGTQAQAIPQSIDRVFETMFVLARDCTDEFTHLSACRCAAIIMNKVGIGSQVHWSLEPISKGIQEVFASHDGDKAKQIRCVHLWAWFTKALECRGHSAAGIFTTTLLSLLEHPGLGREAACGLGLVFEDFPSVLSMPLHAAVSPMYKQRVFSLNLKTLLEGYDKVKASKETAEHYLLAFSLITCNIPQQVLKPHLNKLVSLLLVSLDRLAGPFQQSTLSTLTNAVQHAPDSMVNSIDSLIPRLLSIARVDPKMTVRIAALGCLEKIASLPDHCIAPHQPRVVKELAGTLDDKKRLVRVQAVEARNAWIMTQEQNK